MSSTPTGPPTSQTPPAVEAVQAGEAAKTLQVAQAAHGLELPHSGAVVLDASFVIALLQRHPGATALAHVLSRGVLTTVTAGEIFYKIAATGGAEPHRIEAVLRAQGVRIAEVPLGAAHHFPRLRRIDAARRAEQKTRGEKGATLSLADLCVLGYAATQELPVLTGDRHWATLAPHGLSVPVHLYQQ